jgi:prephenate dehydrogenase (NADP+)
MHLLDLFKTPDILASSIQAALFDKSIRMDDLEFVMATQAWSQTILLGSMDGYRDRFNDVSAFFEGQLTEAKTMSSRMMAQVAERWQQRQAKN